jgi:hypothetical protein
MVLAEQMNRHTAGTLGRKGVGREEGRGHLFTLLLHRRSVGLVAYMVGYVHTYIMKGEGGELTRIRINHPPFPETKKKRNIPSSDMKASIHHFSPNQTCGSIFGCRSEGG